MKLILFMILFSNSAWAQTLGNPGGGGPDGESPEQLCVSHQRRIETLETKFIKLWNKFKLGASENLSLLTEIEMELMVSYLIQFDPVEKNDLGTCKYVLKNLPPFNRPHFNEERKLLDEMIVELEKNLTLSQCHYFPEDVRKEHLERIRSIRNYYGK
jgi:hypothetical protein